MICLRQTPLTAQVGISREHDAFDEARYGEEDLNREMEACSDERSRLRRELRECRRAAGYPSPSCNDLDEKEHGTCSEPRTDLRRESCLGGCNEQLGLERGYLENLTEANRDVPRALEERIERCRGGIEELRQELDECRDSDSDDETSAAPETPATTGTTCTSSHCR